jgi:hypothetical protein
MLTPTLIIALGIMAAGLAFLLEDPRVPPRRAFVPGVVLFVAVIAMLGFQGFPVGPTTAASTGDEHVTLFSVMTNANGRSVSSDFEGARLIGVMGRWTLDLRQARIPPGEKAVVDVFAAMGKVTMLLPDGWTVDTTALRVMGAVDDGRRALPERGTETTGAASRLVLRGVVMMGKVEIQS